MTETGLEFCRAWDPATPENIQDPYSFFAEARKVAGIFHSDVLDAWVVTRYADVESILTDHERFSNASAINPPEGLDPQCAELVSRFGWIPNFDTDPPVHTRIRMAVSQAFTARRVAQLEPEIRQLAEVLLDDLEQRGSPADMVGGFCLPFSSRVIFGMLGVPDADLGRVHQWTQRFIELYVAHITDENDLVRVQECVDYWEYCTDLIDRRIASPGEDLISGLASQVKKADGTGDRDDAALSREEIASIFMLLVVAGHETTSNMLGSLLLHLLSDRRRWEDVRGDADLRPLAVEEVLRIDAPVQVLHRVTRCPVDLGGVHLPAGVKVLVPFGPANHDETVFDQPELFDLRQQRSARHLAFSKGVHYCMGAALARLEGRVALDCITERLPTLHLAATASGRYHPIYSIRSLQELHVAW